MIFEAGSYSNYRIVDSRAIWYKGMLY